MEEFEIEKEVIGNPTPLSVLGLCKKLDWILSGFVTRVVSEVTTSHTLVYQGNEIELSMTFKISLEGKYFEMYLKTSEPRERTTQWYGTDVTVETLLETITQLLEGDDDD